jgi:Zn-dependent peptidase ImmA (M78 family)
LCTARQRFTVAHELGHILLGHAGKYELVNREPSANDNPIEQAANVFASRLLAPACVLWGCGIQMAGQIANMCDISQIAAEFRMARMAKLYARGKFLTSPLERAVFAQFESFISENLFKSTIKVH